MKQFSLLALLITVFFSCKDEEVQIQSVSSCIGDPEPNDWTGTCADFSYDTAKVCSCADMGSFKLEESSLEYLPLYCKEIGEVISFENDKGEMLHLEVSVKAYKRYSSLHYSYKPCADNSTKVNTYLLEFEQLSIWLKSETNGLQLLLSLKTKPDLAQHGEGRVGDFLEITRRKNSNYWTIDLTAVVNQRNLSYHETFSQEYYEQIELLGKTFRRVISTDISYHVDPKPYKYYYTAEQGLVGFIDQSGVLWRIVD